MTVKLVFSGHRWDSVTRVHLIHSFKTISPNNDKKVLVRPVDSKVKISGSVCLFPGFVQQDGLKLVSAFAKQRCLLNVHFVVKI